tara:strand:- start:3253 stop:3663 length:411 start_codon:yes stop_codon:yes gene_type:complete
MKNLKPVHMLLLTLLAVAIGGCAPMLLAGGAVVGAKGYVNDTAHEEQLGKHSKEISNNLSKVRKNSETIKSNLSKVKQQAKTIDSNLLKVEENKNHIDALHEKIKMLESTVINLQKLLLDKPQPTQVIGGSDNVVR